MHENRKVSRVVDVRVSKWRVMNFYNAEPVTQLFHRRSGSIVKCYFDLRVIEKEDCRHKSRPLDSFLGELNLVLSLCPCCPLPRSFLTTLPTV